MQFFFIAPKKGETRTCVYRCVQVLHFEGFEDEHRTCEDEFPLWNVFMPKHVYFKVVLWYTSDSIFSFLYTCTCINCLNVFIESKYYLSQLE